MNKILTCLILSAFSLVHAEDFYNTPTKFKLLKNESKTIDVYPNWSDFCEKGHERVTYTYYDNQSDEMYAGACALTYSYAKCSSSDPDCKSTKVKQVTNKKLISTSNINKSICTKKKNRLVSKLKDLGFTCEGSGIN